MLLGPGSQVEKRIIIDIKRFPSIYVCGCVHRNVDVGYCSCKGRTVSYQSLVGSVAVVAWGPKTSIIDALLSDDDAGEV